MKTAWVTGASSGIGEALAVALAGEGWAVILSGRRIDALMRVSQAIPGPTLVLPFEATDYDSLPAIVAQAQAWRGGIDLLINNAGVSQRSLALDTSFEVYRSLLEIDFVAPLRLTQLVLPQMVERRAGHLVAISSLAGKMGIPLRTGYCAAKHALIGYFAALRAEIELAYGIDVTIVSPGSVRTSVAMNAFLGDGSIRGDSDQNIEAGIDPQIAARIILDGFAAGCRDIVVAEGGDLAAEQLRHSDPERLEKLLAQEGVRLAEDRARSGPDFRPEPHLVPKSLEPES